MRSNLLANAVFVAAISLTGAVQAQTFVRPDCRDALSALAINFDTPEHQRWYKRFWTGDCETLSFCISGSPNWNDVVSKLLARGGPAERAALLPKACRLGRVIGLEWSRERNVRRIDTGDLREFNKILDKSGDALRGVDEVDALVQQKLNR
jgi:hypothetical protein